MNTESTVLPNETMRQWYTRKTRGALRALFASTAIVLVAAVLLWTLAEMEFLARMQTFNGALIIPCFGGIWIAAFLFIWLIPMRELSFRGQESLDRMEVRTQKALEEEFIPAARVWKRIGERVEQDLLPRLEKIAKEAEARIGPTAESVRRMENMADGKLGLLVTDVREAAGAVKKFFGPQGAPADLDSALGLMSQPKNGQPVQPVRRL